MSTLATVIQHSIGSPSHSNQRIKRKKGIQIGKEEVKLSPFADDIILYIENLKDARILETNEIRKLPELINEFGKVAGYKINAQKSLAFLYTNNERSEREIKETIPFAILNNKNKIPRNKPNQRDKRAVCRKL